MFIYFKSVNISGYLSIFWRILVWFIIIPLVLALSQLFEFTLSSLVLVGENLVLCMNTFLDYNMNVVVNPTNIFVYILLVATTISD